MGSSWFVIIGSYCKYIVKSIVWSSNLPFLINLHTKAKIRTFTSPVTWNRLCYQMLLAFIFCVWAIYTIHLFSCVIIRKPFEVPFVLSKEHTPISLLLVVLEDPHLERYCLRPYEPPPLKISNLSPFSAILPFFAGTLSSGRSLALANRKEARITSNRHFYACASSLPQFLLLFTDFSSSFLTPPRFLHHCLRVCAVLPFPLNHSAVPFQIHLEKMARVCFFS